MAVTVEVGVLDAGVTVGSIGTTTTADPVVVVVVVGAAPFEVVGCWVVVTIGVLDVVSVGVAVV